MVAFRSIVSESATLTESTGNPMVDVGWMRHGPCEEPSVILAMNTSGKIGIAPASNCFRTQAYGK